MNFPTLLNLHELTPFFSPLYFVKRHTASYTPSLRSREGERGEFVEKVILFGAILSYTEGLINHKRIEHIKL